MMDTLTGEPCELSGDNDTDHKDTAGEVVDHVAAVKVKVTNTTHDKL